MEQWLLSNMSIWVFWPISVMGLFSGMLLLNPSRIKRLLVLLGIFIVAGEFGLGYWLINRQVARATESHPTLKPSSPTKARTAPSSPKPQQKPEAQELSSGVVSEPDSSNLASFFLTSVNTPSIRTAYCIDATVRGQFRSNSNSIDIMVEKADFDLCKESDTSQRQVIYKVGIGKREDVVKRNMDALIWSQPVTGRITTGAEAHLAPQLLSIKKIPFNKGAIDLSNYVPVVRVYNPEKSGEYFLFGNFQ